MNKLSRVGIDLAKNVFQLHSVACAGAHHWARELQAKGFTVKLIAPQFVKPYVKSNKNRNPVVRRAH